MPDEENQNLENQETPEVEGDEPAEEDGVVLKFKDDGERQKWLDRQFSGRYKSKQKQIREEERAALEAEMKEQQAKEKGEYRELYQKAEGKIGEQAATIAELEAQVADVQSRDERIASLEAQVEAFIKPDLERVPEHYRELVSGMSLDQQAAWLTRNRERLQGPDNPIGSPATPAPPKRDVSREIRENDKEVAELTRSSISSIL